MATYIKKRKLKVYVEYTEPFTDDKTFYSRYCVSPSHMEKVFKEETRYMEGLRREGAIVDFKVVKLEV